jgi:hypothetical protein
MNQAMIDFLWQQDSGEDFTTPLGAAKVLQENILWHGNKPVIWEPCDADGQSNITKVYKKMGHKVITSGLPKVDFLRQRKPLKGAECIITNPPYSLKDDFLEQCFSLGLPFCLLLPLTALEGIRRKAKELVRKSPDEYFCAWYTVSLNGTVVANGDIPRQRLRNIWKNYPDTGRHNYGALAIGGVRIC